ncbi:MAG: Lrp/AsnC family transcriptional regulator [Thaumarchaeota archaeon]|nr:MAG: Lrp/AsnC family transcriptional regulator [Nitrososphaerota archaeon]
MPTAFVLVKCEQGTEERIIQDLNRSDSIREVQPTIGHYDLIAKITSPSTEHINDIIEEIQRDDKVHLAQVLLRMNQIVEAA